MNDYTIHITGPWTIEIDADPATTDGHAHAKTLQYELEPPAIRRIERERYDGLPLFDDTQPGWRRGQRLFRVRAQETSVKNGVVPGSLAVYPAADGGVPFRENIDYIFDHEWAAIGRTTDGRIKAEQPVWISYEYGLSRIDSVVVDESGVINIIGGENHVSTPQVPPIPGNAGRIANIHIRSRQERLDECSLFPILEERFPTELTVPVGKARRHLARTRTLLESGQPCRILAWGDSVTNGGYLQEHDGFPEIRWQEKFRSRLLRRYPKAQIRLITTAWGGRRSMSFVEEPTGSPHNYREAVLDMKPNLIVSEFVNDAYLTDPAELEEIYGRYLEDFRKIGAEWIIIVPHYVRPDWMGLAGEREIDQDPRPYVAALKSFGSKNDVPLADTSQRWGRLWRMGIPYTTFLLNAINHPDERGMEMFTDSLMEWFPDD